MDPLSRGKNKVRLKIIQKKLPDIIFWVKKKQCAPIFLMQIHFQYIMINL